jgi:PIN domain nuclease of toxin-antitoxin system
MMRILLDSHALFWFLDGDARLSHAARDAIEAPGAIVNVSAVTAVEVANKVRAGKWPAAEMMANGLLDIVVRFGFEPLPLSLEHARHAGMLAVAHRDPFDRMLAAQAEIEAIPLVTADPVFAQFPIQILW